MDRGQREKQVERLRKGILAECVLVLLFAVLVIGRRQELAAEKSRKKAETQVQERAEGRQRQELPFH